MFNFATGRGEIAIRIDSAFSNCATDGGTIAPIPNWPTGRGLIMTRPLWLRFGFAAACGEIARGFDPVSFNCATGGGTIVFIS